MSKPLSGTVVVVQVDNDRLAAIEVKLRGNGVLVERAICAVRPASVQSDEPAGMGAWVKQVLAEAGVSTKRAILAAARGEVVLKVLEFPGTGLVDEAERCEVVRLQMARQLTMPMSESVIDWIPMDRGEDGAVRSVMAGAIHTDRLDWYDSISTAAGLKPVGMQLSSGGIAALTADLEGPVLVVVPSMAGIEFVVAWEGRVMFARAIELPEGFTAATEPEVAERIPVEAKRTWMSYRVSQRAEDIEVVAVIGSDGNAEAIRSACARLLEIESRCVGLPDRVSVNANLQHEQQALVSSLIGLAVRASTDADRMDFLNPHEPPDAAANRRIVALAAIFVLIVLLGGGFLVRGEKLRSLEKVRSGLKENEGKLAQDYLAYLGDLARAEHLTRWDELDADYLGHIGWLSERLPDPTISLADRIALAVAGQVRYDGRTFPGANWQSPARLAVSVSGKVGDRAIALDLRDRLLRDGPYVVANRGPDVADRYDFELTTSALADPTASGAPTDPDESSRVPPVDDTPVDGTPTNETDAAKTPADGEGP